MLIGTVVLYGDRIGTVTESSGTTVKLALDNGTDARVSVTECQLVATPEEVLEAFGGAICAQAK